jgi:hypothetical protein
MLPAAGDQRTGPDVGACSSRFAVAWSGLGSHIWADQQRWGGGKAGRVELEMLVDR